ncbi:hypothetical protein [Gemmatimonas sp.]|jgi:hypothetical protein|uniref:hypothetical protein n=1 Tax=Gemmatimonas sp. TaxID=1962908 RepID=UPI0037BFD67E
MLRDLLDALRCPHPHAESWLVAVVHETDGLTLVAADLACPVCGAEFAIAEGVAYFGTPDVLAPPPQATFADEPLRLAALLGAADGDTPVLLSGRYALAGNALAELVNVPQLWVNAPAEHRPSSPRTSQMIVGAQLPLGVATLAAAALDVTDATAAMLDSVMRAVKQGGRIVAPASVPRPEALKELARDEREWVAEVTTRASGLIELRRRTPDAVG